MADELNNGDSNEVNNSQPVDKEVSVDELEELRESLAEARLLLVQERNRRLFQRAAEKTGIRYDRIDAAMKLAEIDALTETIDDDEAKKIAEKILAGYPEFAQKQSPLSTDQGVPGNRKSRTSSSGNALELLKILRRS